ncbi:Glutamyl-tRNA(Gln) amidotransferase subunit A [Seminavis robusta]|uniref:Glutamyl-tRNA(Gln) amidotransferase subunit A n=1 Tax=Seminavis robusta TaxID=568900 RepID=A0A9N8HCP6_9STRA|nr:Glutamyl-tRNA(Gln) amidotransferase subunit A [Seminavis robusta]|eukprot:Sro311_g114210.1 Glutamyl-tRNA(Gln) amidotransferase subunit A (611) ;mRNA; r:14344-16638
MMESITSTLQLLTPKDVWNVFAHTITIGLIVGTVFFLDDYRIKIDRQNQLNDWIRRARQEKASKEHKVLDMALDDESKMELLTAKETREQILAKTLDPKQNVAFLAKRCRAYNQDRKYGVNAIAEELYDEAYETASSLDKNVTADTAPPLYGVPVSIKESNGVKGTFSTGGLACRLNKRQEEDSLPVELIRKAGAIPICTGNTIQLMMLAESTNRIWGRSRNPWDLSRTPGGSSGGDAALVAMGCVPLAIGSDIAGSIRIPACFSGIVGFKPTSTRLSGKGCMKPRKDDKAGSGIAIPATGGPMAKTVDDCFLVMKAMCTPDLWESDLNVPPVPFKEEIYLDQQSKLKIGYFTTDGWFEPCATSKRALKETLDALTKAGHECVEFEPPTDGWHNYGLLVGINSAEGNFKSFLEALEGEECINEYSTLIRASNIPDWLRWILVRVLDKRRAHLLGSTRNGGISVFELWKRTAELLSLRSAWSDAVREAGVDALVYPGFPIPAAPHGISGDLTAAVSYMFMPNLLLWPSGVVPVTTVRTDEQHYRMEDLPLNQRDKAAKITADRVMKNSEGMPLSVSVMTPAFEDEKCLRVMKEIERLVDFKAEPSAYKKYR